MTDRKKKGIGFLVGAGLFLTGGVVFLAVPTTPDWLGVVFGVVSAVAQVLGIVAIVPDTA